MEHTKRMLFDLNLKMVVLIAPLFFFSCKSHQAIESISSDSTLVIRDTVIQIIERNDTFYLPSNVIHDTVIIKEKSQLRIKVKENQIQIICHENEYKLKLDSVIQSKRVIITKHETISKHECKSQWHYFCNIFFWIVMVLIILKMIIGKYL